MRKAFEIVYADGTIVDGTTKAAFKKAPEEGIQFVIVRERDGSVTIHKAANTYEFNGATKKGSWTEKENYEELKRSLHGRSKLLVAPRDPRDARRSKLLRERRTL